MRSIFSIFLLIPMLFQLQVEARQVRVLSEKLEFNGKVNTTQRKSLILQNDSNQPAEYFLRYLRGNIGSSQNIKICLGDNCYDPRKDLSRIIIPLNAGEIFTDLYIEFDLGITETKGTFELHFFKTGDPRDIFIIEGLYNVVSDTPSENVSHQDIDMGGVYPNPSSRTAQLDYKIKNPEAKARIVVNSFIGNPIYDFSLDPTQGTLVIPVTDLYPGVYLYTLIVDDKNIVTKKLVVKR